MRASVSRGIRTSTTRPATTRHPLTARMTPPVATTRRGSSEKGFATTSSASGSRIESASTMATSGYRATLTPTLIASERPEFALRTRTRGVRPSEGTWTERAFSLVTMSSGTTRGTSTRSYASRSRS